MTESASEGATDVEGAGWLRYSPPTQQVRPHAPLLLPGLAAVHPLAVVGVRRPTLHMRLRKVSAQRATLPNLPHRRCAAGGHLWRQSQPLQKQQQQQQGMRGSMGLFGAHRLLLSRHVARWGRRRSSPCRAALPAWAVSRWWSSCRVPGALHIEPRVSTALSKPWEVSLGTRGGVVCCMKASALLPCKDM